MTTIQTRPIEPADAPFVFATLVASWDGTTVVSRGVEHDAARLPGFVATIDEEPVGVLTYDVRGGALEVVTIDAVERRQGVGRALLQAAVEEADRQACWRLWLVTTNDNLDALAFYLHCGLRLVAVHLGRGGQRPRDQTVDPDGGHRRRAAARRVGARAVVRRAGFMRRRSQVRPPSAHPSGARPPAVPPALVPRHVAVVMDGNGRWAKQRGLPRTAGHEAGEAALFDLVEGAIEVGVRYVSAFAFSTENWRRSPDEVRFLMGFNRDVIRRRRDEMHALGVRVRWAGRRPRLWKSVIDELEEAERLTAGNTVLTLTMCVNYGGRAEIADAAARIAADARAGRLDPDKVDEKAFARYLDEPQLPDVDLFLRSSGEQRISNFMLWQSAYAELVFLDVLWPDVDRRTLWRAIEVYASRDRRYGAALPKADADSPEHRHPRRPARRRSGSTHRHPWQRGRGRDRGGRRRSAARVQADRSG